MAVTALTCFSFHMSTPQVKIASMTSAQLIVGIFPISGGLNFFCSDPGMSVQRALSKSDCFSKISVDVNILNVGSNQSCLAMRAVSDLRS
jgi:hypothetical protein